MTRSWMIAPTDLHIFAEQSVVVGSALLGHRKEFQEGETPSLAKSCGHVEILKLEGVIMDQPCNFSHERYFEVALGPERRSLH